MKKDIPFRMPLWVRRKRRLRHVVTEGGVELVLVAFRIIAYAGPAIAFEIAVLNALTEAALWSTIEVIPVTQGVLLDILRGAAAVGGSAWLVACLRRGSRS